MNGQATIKDQHEVSLMRTSGALLAQVFNHLDKHVQAGVSTMQLNDIVERYIVDTLNARPASKGQYDYPYAINSSVNEVVCHGMPSTARSLRSKDIVNIDITLEQGGFIADSSKTYVLSGAGPSAKRLAKTCYQAMWAGIREVRPGASLGDVGFAIQAVAEKAGYSVVREYCGHGIGRSMHEAPQVLHYGRRGTGVILRPGMTFTIEPMINQGSHKTRTKKDGWTVVTKDKQLSAQWEHTVLVTDDGVEVLTLRDEERGLLS